MATSTLTSTVQPPAVHPETGLPVQRVATFAVGDLVTTGYGSDGYPGVVVAVEGKGKTVYVRSLHHGQYVIGNVTADSHANYMDDTTLVVAPGVVEALVAEGKEGASKFVLRVYAKADGGGSSRERDLYGAEFHRARWAVPNSTGGHISQGARYRIDPHF